MNEKIVKDFKTKAVIIAIIAAVLITFDVIGIVKELTSEETDEKARYSESVTATVSKEDELWATNSKNIDIIFKYTYDYSFGGKDYSRRSYDEVDEKNRYKIGQIVKIYIDPDSPEDFYDPMTSDIGKKSSISASPTKRIVSIGFVAALAAVIIIVLHKNMKKKLASAESPEAPDIYVPEQDNIDDQVQ